MLHLVLCSRFKNVSQKLWSESNKHKVNVSPVSVLITCDQCWCLLVSEKWAEGQRGSEEEADSNWDSNFSAESTSPSRCKNRLFLYISTNLFDREAVRKQQYNINFFFKSTPEKYHFLSRKKKGRGYRVLLSWVMRRVVLAWFNQVFIKMQWKATA